MRIIFIFALFFSSYVFAETINTSVNDVVLKNYKCNSFGGATFNLVNRTEKAVSRLYFKYFDNEGDPLDSEIVYGVAAKSGIPRKTFKSCNYPKMTIDVEMR